MELMIEAVLDYAIDGPTPAVLMVEAAGMTDQTVIDAHIDLHGAVAARVPGEEGVGERLIWRAEQAVRCDYRARIRIDRPLPDFAALPATPYEALPGDALRYSLPSRFCPSDRFGPFVAQDFAGLSGGALAVALRDWVAAHIAYVPGSSGPETTAVDSFVARQGVCRDFAHLLVSLCRAAAIPARYVSAYGPDVTPQDFHAAVQVYLAGGWHLLDATGMGDAGNMAVIGVGRDATDVAFLATIDPARLVAQSVSVSRA